MTDALFKELDRIVAYAQKQFGQAGTMSAAA